MNKNEKSLFIRVGGITQSNILIANNYNFISFKCITMKQNYKNLGVKSINSLKKFKKIN